MKSLFVLFLSIIASTSFASANELGRHPHEPIPVLRLHKNSGYTLPEFAVSSVCEIYADGKVIVEKVPGYVHSDEVEIDHLKTHTTKQVQLSGSLSTILRLAHEGEILQKEGPVDGPTSIYMGGLHTTAEDGTLIVLPVMLKSTGHHININQSPAAKVLINLIDQNCH